jgi:peptidoglycan/LPS O-acetylase OafA/YrhL
MIDSGKISCNEVREIVSHTGLRGLAAFSVLLLHISVFKGETVNWNINSTYYKFFIYGGYPVDLFFILSGFILQWVYLNQATIINWKLYYTARFARLVPLYYLTLLFILPLCCYSNYTYGLSYVGPHYNISLISSIFMVAGILGEPIKSINGPAWSISVEVLCYVMLFPVLAWMYKKNKFPNRIISVIILILFLINFDYLYWDKSFIQINSIIWDASQVLRGFFGFTIGFLLCLIINKSNWNPSSALINLVSIAVICFFIIIKINIVPEGYVLFSLPAIVFFTAYDKGIIFKLLRNNIFQWLGNRSYSIYLWHLPIMGYFIPISKYIIIPYIKPLKIAGFMKLSLLISIILIVSELSYKFFEMPFRRFIRNHAK